MELKASDLPESLKNQLLSQIQDHIGSTDYNKMIDAIGEDGVINLALEQMNKGGNLDSIVQEESEPVNIVATVVSIILIFVIVVSVSIVTFIESGLGDAIGTFIFGIFYGFLFFSAVYWLIRHIHYVVGLAVLGGLLVGVGYLLWKAVAFTGGGAISWFKWLFGHL